ncbi:MAG: tripartite tricarboxylate transporter substrate-binding protein, partial [Alphaproteobacteria bacterium]|nr:tripartite tricarboxylate transporter substrate-binding protein [Alphaproteobacteria bacterium]
MNVWETIMIGRISALMVGGLVVLLALSPSSGASAAGLGDFYKNKTITLYIGYGFGGTYGKYSRTMAEHMPKHIAGNPKIIVKSQPGAGGIKMTNFASKVMPRQGYNIFIPPDMSVVSQLLRPDKVKYDAREFTWLGSSNQTNTITVVRSDSGVKNWADFQRKQVIMGHTGPGSTSFVMPTIYAKIMGAKIKLIGGYKGSSKTVLAIEQGEIQGASFNWLLWSSKVPHWFKKDKQGKIYG